MKVLLVTEGTYPIAHGGVSTWCDHLVRSLRDIDFGLLALGATGAETAVWELPPNIRRARVHGVWGDGSAVRRPQRANRARRRLERALIDLWRAVLGPDGDAAVDAARAALWQIVAADSRSRVDVALSMRSSAEAVATAWRAVATARGWPDMTVAQAVAIANVVDRTLALVSIRPPVVDIVHATANGPCGLVALASAWRCGARIVLTEHGVYLRELYLSMRKSNLDLVTRRALTAFVRRLSEVVLREATWVLPVSDFNQTWEHRLGAPPERVRTIVNAVNPSDFSVVSAEPTVPTISFVGRIDPLKDLETLIRAHALVLDEVPEARLRLFGPVPAGNEPYAQRLAGLSRSLGTEALVSFEGRVPTSRPAIEAGHLVALSSISEGLPYTLIEALMCGRATVSTDVGGVAECVAGDGSVGLIVPPRSPQAFARACVDLLTDDGRRRRMGADAARWARRRFNLDDFADAYRFAYYSAVTGEADAPAAAPLPVLDPVMAGLDSMARPSVGPLVTTVPAAGGRGSAGHGTAGHGTAGHGRGRPTGAGRLLSRTGVRAGPGAATSAPPRPGAAGVHAPTPRPLPGAVEGSPSGPFGKPVRISLGGAREPVTYRAGR